MKTDSAGRPQLRNVAIIAHVDHGKTTLVDAMLQHTGAFRRNEDVKSQALDTGELERERGITILAKQTSVQYGDIRINIIDTPGHADFGGEVERTLMMADGALLLVDAAEGPLPQTRFVLGKALGLGLPIIVVVNKIDRSDARPDDVLTEVFDLFCELDASDEQTDFAAVYAVGKDGIAKLGLDDDGTSLDPLFETIIGRVPAPGDDPEGPFQMLVTNVEHDDYVGQLAVGRVRRGRVGVGDEIAVMLADDRTKTGRIVRLYTFAALRREEIKEATAGDIVAVAGLDGLHIGDTLTDKDRPEAMPRIAVEEPTIKIQLLVNDSPLSGQSGKKVTSRQVRDRLARETKKNLAMRFEDTDSPDTFTVYGRGELMLAILAETMRREGYEFSLGMPEVVVKDIDGRKHEPLERVFIDVPEEHVGTVTQSLGERRGQLDAMNNLGSGRSRLQFVVPARGLIGYRSQFLTETRGTGLLNTTFEGWTPYQGVVLRRKGGALVSDRAGKTTPYALFNLQPRGHLFITSGETIYEGMVIGEHNRPNDLVVNATREKKLTNIRAAGRDENVQLSGFKAHTIETALEWIDRDELLEVTPDALRLRKRVLRGALRPRRDDERAG
ncbi:MAG: translational GTPase TypA [Myxococcota bacterium]